MCVVMFMLAILFGILLAIYEAQACEEPKRPYIERAIVGIVGIYIVTYCFICAFLFHSIQHWWYATTNEIEYYDLPTEKYKEHDIDVAKSDALWMSIYYECDGNHARPCHKGDCNRNREWLTIIMPRKQAKLASKYDELTKDN